jgi:hypothetical protein
MQKQVPNSSALSSSALSSSALSSFRFKKKQRRSQHEQKYKKNYKPAEKVYFCATGPEGDPIYFALDLGKKPTLSDVVKQFLNAAKGGYVYELLYNGDRLYSGDEYFVDFSNIIFNGTEITTQQIKNFKPTEFTDGFEQRSAYFESLSKELRFQEIMEMTKSVPAFVQPTTFLAFLEHLDPDTTGIVCGYASYFGQPPSEGDNNIHLQFCRSIDDRPQELKDLLKALSTPESTQELLERIKQRSIEL